MWIKTKVSSSKGIIPLEDKYWHLLETPFHNLLQVHEVIKISVPCSIVAIRALYAVLGN